MDGGRLRRRRCNGSLSPSLDVSSGQIQAIVATPSGGGYWLATRRLP
jgi:hypothetical protein